MKPINKLKNKSEKKVIIFHGFSGEELTLILDGLSKIEGKPANIIMATTTETSLKWKVKDLIGELIKEHKEMTGK
jgi:hypothetical protein